MKTVHIHMNDNLAEAVDEEAKRWHLNRSTLVSKAVKRFLDDAGAGVRRSARKSSKGKERIEPPRAKASRAAKQPSQAQLKLEQRHIAGYRKQPLRRGEIKAWERVQEWPEE
jgi:hypothetical protein